MTKTVIQEEFAVAVVIPTHNCLEYLKKSLKSIVDQTVEDIQIIVVVDRSSDGTAAWLAQYDCPRPLTIIETDVGSPALARNLGVEEARAPLVAFLDDDDVWMPGKLAAQIAAHQADPEVVLSFTDYRHRTLDGQDFGTCFDYWGAKPAIARGFTRLNAQRSTLLGRNLVGTSTVMVRRDAFLAVGGFDPSLPSSEDWDLWLSLAGHGPVSWSPDVTTEYLLRPGSLTKARHLRIAAMTMIAQRHLSRGPTRWQDRLRLRARLLVGHAEALEQNNRRGIAAGYHFLAGLMTADRRALRAGIADLSRSFQRT
ncbi:glycosyltransferase family A protein [Elstera litoralis]|uniref:glycosyltransferase family A protein n=1 Tax=Elstera litoralis TaxID=552518 RepID=UPI0009FD86AA|nr:glycosyltransferase family A protein [Elstera litoralis]